jgi:tRNA/rRNA methyltransferase
MLSNLAVVLFRPKFSENVGSTARAMANMGCRDLIVVGPQDFDEGRARALATAKGQLILDRMTLASDLSQALAPFGTVYGTTARTGGWRTGLLTPETAAARAIEGLRAGTRIALLFGPEDQGLTNDETMVCSRLVTIPTSDEATSLNLAQAVLIVLYEFLKASRIGPCQSEADPDTEPQPLEPASAAATIGDVSSGHGASELSRAATHQEREVLFANLRETLTAIDYLPDQNTDYWMLPVRSVLTRLKLKRSDFNLLMGVCRQVKWAVERKKEAD